MTPEERLRDLAAQADDASQMLTALDGLDRERIRLSRGWIGVALGMGAEKDKSIAFIVVVLSLAIISWIMATGIGGEKQSDYGFGFLSLVTLALGYIFGRKSD